MVFLFVLFPPKRDKFIDLFLLLFFSEDFLRERLNGLLRSTKGVTVGVLGQG